MVLYNVAFPSAHLRELEQRYGPDIASVISRPGGRLIRHLGSSELRSLVSEYERLDRSPRSEIALHAFLIRSLAVIAADTRDDETAEEGTGPIWLRSAIDRLRSEPGRLAGGVPELARLCGRHPDHINRACRRSYGATASEVVNGLRLDRAEDLLRETDASVSWVAEESGFSNQSYFFRRFRERTGMTPIRFRERHQRPVRISG
jgi:AraC family cel operon transcriptional repressor